MFLSGMGMGYSPNWAKPRQQHPEPYRSRYPRRRLARATASSACPASISLAKASTSSWPLVPIRPQLRTRRDGAEQVALDHEAVEPPDALLRVDPVQHQVVLDRGAQLVRHRRAECRPAADVFSRSWCACGSLGSRASSSAA